MASVTIGANTLQSAPMQFQGINEFPCRNLAWIAQRELLVSAKLTRQRLGREEPRASSARFIVRTHLGGKVSITDGHPTLVLSDRATIFLIPAKSAGRSNYWFERCCRRFSILAQVSFKGTVRLKTRRPGRLSGSTQK